MNVFTSAELASRTKAVYEAVRRDGCAFVANDGKVDCMMVDLSMFDTMNEAIRSYDQWVAQRELELMWKRNVASGVTLEDIDAEIAVVRSERRGTRA
ncbi:hypothetical protein [Adlercreutzia sp. ZJ473]|uniref:hypothetical protein n=1 Tax=Adlercreutzia sp. ZJ473 TaxID=2722822 RepID=UPI001555A88C|nr:hypothetical protein [Adlercreutzia sp. ZJ473]